MFSLQEQRQNANANARQEEEERGKRHEAGRGTPRATNQRKAQPTERIALHDVEESTSGEEVESGERVRWARVLERWRAAERSIAKLSSRLARRPPAIARHSRQHRPHWTCIGNIIQVSRSVEHAGDECERQRGRERDPRGARRGEQAGGPVARIDIVVAAVAVVDAHALRAESLDARVAEVLVGHAAALAHHTRFVVTSNCEHQRQQVWLNSNATQIRR